MDKIGEVMDEAASAGREIGPQDILRAWRAAEAERSKVQAR